jgi:hypothetical protein
MVTYKHTLSFTAVDMNIILQFTKGRKGRKGRLWMLNVITKLKLDKEITMIVELTSRPSTKETKQVYIPQIYIYEIPAKSP